ncbi:C39 family peptidase [Eubacterium xylanophilum]|uniref:C39 family peptidase n=1 Tax=Eubacterium xylanophilum TaxID=39497 RepID=UPI00047DE2AE|nr:C39 family peptidase [Eubacterium xylanophilum]
MRKTRRLIATGTMLAFVCLNVNSFHIKAEVLSDQAEVTETITKDDAKDIAEVHTELVEQSQFDCDWNSLTHSGKATPLYNTDKEVIAYEIDIYNGNEKKGYVIVGANEEHPPIIEYSVDGDFWRDIKLAPGEYIVYDGKFGYFKSSDYSEVAEDISTHEKVEKDSLSENKTSLEENRIKSICKNQWEAYEDKVEKEKSDTSLDGLENQSYHNNVNIYGFQKALNLVPYSKNYINMGSTILDDKNYYDRDKDRYAGLTNPNDYESGYVRFKWKEVPSFLFVPWINIPSEKLLCYKGQPMLHCCVSVAASNLLMYWDHKRFGNLVNPKNEIGAMKTLCEIHEGLGGNKEKNLSGVQSVLDTYLRKRNVKNAQIWYWDYSDFTKREGDYTPSDSATIKQWDFLKREIDGGDPFIMEIKTGDVDYYYSNTKSGHALLVVGYSEYKYNELQRDTNYFDFSGYLRVVDGFGKSKYNKADRWLNYCSVYNYTDYAFATCHFIGK